METASLHEIKKELQALPPAKLIELCTRLAKYKKENKELLDYLLFRAHDETEFIRQVKAEMDMQFAEMNKSHVYLAKKTIRKVLRTVNKYVRYSGAVQTAVELRMYFCSSLKASGIPIRRHTVLTNLYEQQLKKINQAIDTMHEDLQYDYRRELETL